MKKVSIIVPAYNEEDRIGKCIDSLLKQTYRNVEIIVVDDGSTDNTLSFLKKYEKKIILISKKNGGQGSARNLGIKKSSGDYIMFVDSDDYIAENMTSKLVEKIENENADIAICDIYKIINNQKIYFKNFISFSENNVKNYMMSHPGPVGRLYKRELFVNNHLYFMENCIYEDLSVIPLLGIYAKKITYLSEAMYYYVIRKGSSMVQLNYSNKLECIFDVMNHLKNEFKIRGKGLYNDVLEYLYIEHLLYSASLRFAKFKRYDMVDKCVLEVKMNFPLFMKNEFMKKKSIKFKIVCFVSYHKFHFILYKLSCMR